MSDLGEPKSPKKARAKKPKAPVKKSKKDFRKVEFPKIIALIHELSKEICDQTGTPYQDLSQTWKRHLSVLDQVKDKIETEKEAFHPTMGYELAGASACLPEVETISKSLKFEIENLNLHSNEFYAVFDVEKMEYIKVDPNIENILGISPDKFTQRALSGFDPEMPIYYTEDLPHTIRCGMIAYFILALPGLEWVARKDYFRIRFLIGTAASSNKTLRNEKHVTVEKKAYISKSQVADKASTKILYTYSVFTKSDYDGNKPYFSASHEQSAYRNSFWYLFNAYTLGINTKYLCMLHERESNDRNKEIGNAISTNIKGATKINTEFTENQISDYFSKTIRLKIEQLVRTWEKRGLNFRITSDQEAIYHAKRLGILPIPPKVVEMIYSGVIDVS